MNTFVPLPSYDDSFPVIDFKRLGNQRSESNIILGVLLKRPTKKTGKPSKGWHHHPATLMWKGFENALAHYFNCCVEEFIRRGGDNHMEFEEINPRLPLYPPWFGDDRIYSSHRSQLLLKNYSWYSQFGWSEPVGDIPYFWPTKEADYAAVYNFQAR